VAVTSDVIAQLALGVGSSVITGAGVWLVQRARSAGRSRRRRRFIGMAGLAGGECRLIVGDHYAQPGAVHRRDMAAMLELATVVRSAGGRAVVMSAGDATAPTDDVEFCVGGTRANRRTEAHLRRCLPGLSMRNRDGVQIPDIVVGTTEYHVSDEAHYGVVARVCRPERPNLFLVFGQTGVSTVAMAAHLAARIGELDRRFGADETFCLVLRAHTPRAYGYSEVEELADVTGAVLDRSISEVEGEPHS
jgi:hypothetical protein